MDSRIKTKQTAPGAASKIASRASSKTASRAATKAAAEIASKASSTAASKATTKASSTAAPKTAAGTISRAASILLSMLISFSLITAGTAEIFAAGSWSIWTNSKLFVGQLTSVTVGNSDSSKTATLTSVKSSDKSVLKVIKNSSGGETWYQVLPKKTGKAKLTVKYKNSSGNEKTLSKTIKVKKYPNQIKSLKVNGKKVTISDNKYQYIKTYKGTTATVKMTLKDGWEITTASANLYNSSSGSLKELKGIKKKVKNGSDISFPKTYDNLNIYINMAKEDNVISYYINLQRPASTEETGTWSARLSNVMFDGQKKTLTVGNDKTGKTAKITSVTSADETIIKAKKKTSGSTTWYQVIAKKTGKTKLTIKIKTPAGNKKTIKKTITVKKYPNQIKSLTVNGKTVNVSENKYQYLKKYTGTKPKIKIELKDGWTISSVSATLYNSKNKKSKQLDNVKSLVKSGKKLSFPKKYNNLNVYINMSKDDTVISYYVNFHR